MNQTHDIDADGVIDAPPSLEPASQNTASTPNQFPSRNANSVARPDAAGMTPDPFLVPPASTNPRTMYICAGIVAAGLVLVAGGLMFGGGRSEPRRSTAAPAPSIFSEQQQMAREAMSMAREAQQMQRERMDMLRQQMSQAEEGAQGLEPVPADDAGTGD